MNRDREAEVKEFPDLSARDRVAAATTMATWQVVDEFSLI